MRKRGIRFGAVAGVALGIVCCGGAVERASSSTVADAGVVPTPPAPTTSTCEPWTGGALADCAPAASLEETTFGAVTGTLPAAIANDCTEQLQLSKAAGTGTFCVAAHVIVANDVWVVHEGRQVKGARGPDGFRVACVDGLPFEQGLEVSVHVTSCRGEDAPARYEVWFEADDGGAADRFTIRRLDPVSGTSRCASPDTLVATPSGERRIDALAEGDLVYSAEDDGFVVAPIAAIRRVPVANHHVVRLALASGAVVAMSAEHPLPGGRTFADVAPGDRLGEAHVVEASRVAYTHPFTMDILPASRSGTYVAGGLVVGSTLHPVRARLAAVRAHALDREHP